MTYLIWINLIFFILTKAESNLYKNTTNYDASCKSGRFKRAPFHQYIPPKILKITIIDVYDEYYITLKQVERYLVNENLPIYTAHLNSWGPNHKPSDIMKGMGNFFLYHDVTHKSSFMYIQNLDKLYGVIGKNYFITNLPMDEVSQPLKVGGQYVHRIPFPSHGPKQYYETTNFGINNQMSERFYIEVLVFVPYDVYIFFGAQFKDTSLRNIITYLIIHFNSVDMVFADLPTDNFQIFINLAGIIIETEKGIFSRITNNPSLEYNNYNVLNIDHIFNHFRRYPDHFDFPFTRDSFDYIILFTGRTLQRKKRAVLGSYSNANDIFAERQQNYDRSFVPMAIIQMPDPFSSYCITAHYIGRGLGIKKSDPGYKGKTIDGNQCYGIMQKSKYHCSFCIRWSDESIIQIKKFTRENRNRCFLLNKPRSLYPLGTPIISSSPCRQCQCFGYDSYMKETMDYCPLYISPDRCEKSLQCKQYNNELEVNILPLDGTPCGEKQVCWNEKCVNF